MILKYLHIENSFVALLGIALGMLLGIAYAYYTFHQFSQLGNVPFTIAWSELIPIGIVAYSASFLATVPPAQRAARLPPAEALRLFE